MGMRETKLREMNSIVAIYETPVDAIEGVSDLRKTGFDMTKVSLVAKESRPEDHIVGYYHAASGMKYWGRMGVFWESVGGLLAGAAFFVVPGIGPVLMTGPLVDGFVAGLEGAPAARGFGAFGTGLSHLSIPGESILRYEFELCSNRLLLFAHGDPSELLLAKETLHRTRPREVNLHFAEKFAPAHR
jgi:hypothetical protein